jgi:hypothetical protein
VPLNVTARVDGSTVALHVPVAALVLGGVTFAPFIVALRT